MVAVQQWRSFGRQGSSKSEWLGRVTYFSSSTSKQLETDNSTYNIKITNLTDPDCPSYLTWQKLMKVILHSLFTIHLNSHHGDSPVETAPWKPFNQELLAKTSCALGRALASKSNVHMVALPCHAAKCKAVTPYGDVRRMISDVWPKGNLGIHSPAEGDTRPWASLMLSSGCKAVHPWTFQKGCLNCAEKNCFRKNELWN